jgi:hypothetical protein
MNETKDSVVVSPGRHQIRFFLPTTRNKVDTPPSMFMNGRQIRWENNQSSPPPADVDTQMDLEPPALEPITPPHHPLMVPPIEIPPLPPLPTMPSLPNFRFPPPPRTPGPPGLYAPAPPGFYATAPNTIQHINFGRLTVNNANIKGMHNHVVGNNNEIDGHNNKITGNNNRVKGSGTELAGNNNEINGATAIVRGNNNTLILANGSEVTGNENLIQGNTTNVRGNHNTVVGDHASVTGSHNIIMGRFCMTIGPDNEVVAGNDAVAEQPPAPYVYTPPHSPPPPPPRLTFASGLAQRYGPSASSQFKPKCEVPPAEDEKSAVAGKEKECLICYDRAVNVVFINCGHLVSCLTCARRLTLEGKCQCPVCNQPISRVVKVFGNI